MIIAPISLNQEGKNYTQKLGFLSPTHYHPHYLLAAVEDNRTTLIYGNTPSGFPDTFEPLEIVVWDVEDDKVNQVDYLTMEDKSMVNNILGIASVISLDQNDGYFVYQIICRLAETITHRNAKWKLTSKDLDKGLLAMGRYIPRVEWFVNYVSGGISFRDRADSDPKRSTFENYLLQSMYPIGELDHLFDDNANDKALHATKTMNAS